MGFLRRDYGAAGLFQLAHSGQLTGVQAVVALTVMTLFVPCVANFLMIVKERGLKVGLAILGVITPIAVFTGAGLNYVLHASWRSVLSGVRPLSSLRAGDARHGRRRVARATAARVDRLLALGVTRRRAGHRAADVSRRSCSCAIRRSSPSSARSPTRFSSGQRRDDS